MIFNTVICSLFNFIYLTLLDIPLCHFQQNWFIDSSHLSPHKESFLWHMVRLDARKKQLAEFSFLFY